MYGRFVEYVEREQLFAGCRRLLLAVSGGVDSVVMLHLLCRYMKEHGGLEAAVAHCNFHLRGEESLRDEKFVRKLSEENGLPLFAISFQTTEYAREHKVSIEMAARELRYAYFSDLMRSQAMDACLLAHHADDNAETFFINLFRGSGLKGLRGMLPKNEADARYLRPLLFARRCEILQYATANKLDFVEDSTNAQTLYLRNRVRHSVLPAIEHCSPGFTDKLVQSMQSLRAVDALVDDWFSNVCAQVVESKGEGEEFISQRKVDHIAPHQDLFWELYLRQKAFNRGQIAQISENFKSGIAGKKFYNSDGSGFLLREPEGWRWTVRKCGNPEEKPLFAEEKLVLKSKEEINPDSSIAYLAFDRLQFPLSWRHWQAGDRFRPLGMKGFRKLSDFFGDLHIGIREKENVWLLCSGKDIVWVAGYRVDDRYKVDFSKPGEKTVWKITLLRDESR